MLTLSDIQAVHALIKKDIAHAYQKKDLNRVISLIDTYAVSVWLASNDLFRDDEIEYYLQKIALNEVGIIENFPTNKDTSKRIIFYDQIGVTCVLGLQYLRGLIANGYEILYIYESARLPLDPVIVSELESYGKATILRYPSKNKNQITLAKEIRDQIIKYGTNQLLIHSPACGALGSIVLFSLPGLKTYRIVPGDHHFYIGYDCIDYFLEFRDFGIDVATKHRNIPLNKIYKIPFYPIEKKNIPFQGFPSETQNKLVFIAAGAEYKFHGSEFYFDMCKYILNRYNQVVFLFIGDCSKKIRDFIQKNHLQGRFIPIGYRKDFNECMKHADALFNSYPFPGGLICQYAACNSLPILSYSEPEHLLNRSVRGALGAEYIDSPISFVELGSFKEYIDKIIANSEFRKSEGKRMFSLLRRKETFDEDLRLILSGKKQTANLQKQTVSDLEYRINYHVELQNKYNPTILDPLINMYGIKTFLKFPSLREITRKNKSYVRRELIRYYGRKILRKTPLAIRHVFKK